MSGDPRPAGHQVTVRLAAFAALAALAGWHWARLVVDPPAGRVGLAVAALTAGAALVALIAAAELGKGAARALAALAALAATAVGLVAIGVPVDLLWPEGWDRLADQVGGGFAGLDGRVEYPYGGENEWSRLVLLAGLPLALGLAAALAFWPSARTRQRPRTGGLAILIATYAVGATVVAPGEPLLWGLLLLVGVAAWLWLPRLGRREAISAGALIAVAGGLSVAAAGAIDAERPWLDYRDWRLARGEGSKFGWDHNYGPLDWPRDGTRVLRVKSDEPHYWKASVLDQFDGRRWSRPGAIAGRHLEVPLQVEEGGMEVDRDALNPNWVEAVEVSFGRMSSDLVVAPGTLLEVTGLEDTRAMPDGTTATGDEPLEDGDAYEALAYVPDPTPEQMRAASRPYSPALARYTEIGLPGRGEGRSVEAPADEVDVPLWGGTAIGDPGARRRILASPYARMYRLAERLTAGEPNAYQAVKAIEAHLRDGPYDYTEAIAPAGRFPLASFLSEERRGYCQQFSGAMALMLRMVGIPSRVATGFSAGSENPDAEDHYLVSDLDAHSWVEVFFGGIGWVAFEPTPAAAPAASQFGEGALAGGDAGSEPGRDGPDRARGGEDEAGATAPTGGGSGLWVILPAGLGLLGLCAGVPAAVRARRYRSLSPAAAADAQLREFSRGATRLDLPIRPGETLLALEHRLRTVSGRATAAYVAKLRRGRFAPGELRPPTLAERRAVRRELRSGPSSRGRLRVTLAFPLGAPRR